MRTLYNPLPSSEKGIALTPTTPPPDFAVVGLGRIGANLLKRLGNAGFRGIGYDPAKPGLSSADSLAALIAQLSTAKPRVVLLSLPEGDITEDTIIELAGLLGRGDIIVDHGNTWYGDDIRRQWMLEPLGIFLVDCGTSGGVFGLERGFCLMYGGDPWAVDIVQPLFLALAPGIDAAPRTDGRTGQVELCENGLVYCGPVGSGHFVKMVHNGIEYPQMAALAEGLNLLAHAGAGCDEEAGIRNAELYQYEELPLDQIVEAWRRSSVISSWLVDLLAAQLFAQPDLAGHYGAVPQSGEGVWTVKAALDLNIPLSVITESVYQRFGSHGSAVMAEAVLNALREAFGGHLKEEKKLTVLS
jgi:6-phosphogluconate dehydrogenase